MQDRNAWLCHIPFSPLFSPLLLPAPADDVAAGMAEGCCS